MGASRHKTEAIRRFIVEQVSNHPKDIAKAVADEFRISRQAVNLHIRRLVDEGLVLSQGSTRSRRYALRPLVDWSKAYSTSQALAEDVVWRDDILPHLQTLPERVLNIWLYAFTEMFNNAIDHSAGHVVLVQLRRTAASVELAIYDDGVGIFRKIQQALALLDERHAVLELAKGKLTTDPARHTGEGIFFTSRVLDGFQILSGGTYFSHEFGEDEDWILERDKFASGTTVWMRLSSQATRTLEDTVKEYESPDDRAFVKTVVPVRLAQYGDQMLVSRSQAKRLLARVERFRTVLLDFKNVETIGSAFADEVFRVFAAQHPEVRLVAINASLEVTAMIDRSVGVQREQG